MINAVVLALTFVFWGRLAALGSHLPFVWVILNSLMVLGTLMPVERAVEEGIPTSDGFQLLAIPFLRSEQLQSFLISAPAARAAMRFERGDFAGARQWVVAALERAPGHVGLKVCLSACQCAAVLQGQAGEYRQAIALLTPLLDDAACAGPHERADVYNILAFAQLMAHAESNGEAGNIDEADRLSDAAFAMYPCVLTHRATRALVLSARGRAAEALPLLDYVHYDGGTPVERSAREIARALAFLSLGRNSEASAAQRRAEKIHALSTRWLEPLAALTCARPAEAQQSQQL
jgi:hypothetical protein